ncbi:MAG TPA: very short patch repair endonuclease [Patescibacteria group bacterium]|nr:very short patch repair endonuclease [Patescibacteria group bacterium]
MSRSENMSRIRSKDTQPEMRVRRALWAAGLRYRLHDKRLPGHPDLVFPGRRSVVFVHGCFWHGHGCHLFKWPSSREEFWRAKIAGTIERDRVAMERLRATGWRVAVVWECALKGRGHLSDEAVAAALDDFLRSAEPQLVLSAPI